MVYGNMIICQHENDSENILWRNISITDMHMDTSMQPSQLHFLCAARVITVPFLPKPDQCNHTSPYKCVAEEQRSHRFPKGK